ncbi:MAG: response regulator transcription factor [Christensenellales bacterium]|jgi:two-component system response regulator YesN
MHTVVLVDDEALAAIDAMHAVDWESCGFEVSAYIQSAVSAQAQLQDLQPDLALIDVNLPGLPGLDLIERCIVSGVRSRFAILSSQPDFECARRAMRLGVADYFLKPLDKLELETFLKRLSSELGAADSVEEHVDPQFARILSYVRRHAYEKLRLDDLAEITGFNKNYICHLFRKQLNTTFIQYVTNLRMRHGCDLLASTFMSIEDVAARCGYPDPAYFNRIFKKAMNMTPAAYRRETIA